jgi:histidinol-phosphate aminotransferase
MGDARTLEARDTVKMLREYHPPLAGRQGLRLDFNESTIGCSPRVLARLRSLDAETLARYPEREPVEREVARFLGLDPAQVLLTNGVDEAIHVLCGTYLDAGDEALIAVPTFAMYAVFAMAEGARLHEIPSEPNFAFPDKTLLSRVTDRTRLIAVANPNNPTGAAVSLDLLVRIAAEVPQAALLVDEAYYEFHGETLLDRTARLPNIFVARTFSKAYGLAGLRIGILAGNTQHMAMVRRVASPYSVNAAALAALPEALADQQHVTHYAADVRHNRTRLEQELNGLGIKHWPSRANFVLIHIGSKHADFVRAMRNRGILVRSRNSDPGCEGCVRLTVGSNEHTGILIDALHGVVQELDLPSEVRA